MTNDSLFTNRRNQGQQPLLKLLCYFKNLFGAGADPVVFGEVDPAYGARAVQQKFCRTGDIVSVFAGALMYQIVTANNFHVGIGKEGKTVAGFLSEVAINFRTIDADCYWTNALFIKRAQIFLNTP